MKFKAIVAYTEKGRVIGDGNNIPWHLPEDFKHFKKNTLNCPIIMGRRTWESLPKICLPKRRNYVISSLHEELSEKFDDDISVADGPFFVPNLHYAVSFSNVYDADGISPDFYADTAWVIGGEHVYRDALKAGFIEEVIATEVKKEYDGDKFFPELEGNWDSEVEFENDDFKIVRYKKVE